MFGVEEQTHDISMVVCYVMGFSLIGYAVIDLRKAIIRIAGPFYYMFILISVPITTLTANNAQTVLHMLTTNIENGESISFLWIPKLFEVILYCFGIFFFSIFFFYTYRPIRRQNIIWRLSNMIDFLRVMLGIVRAVVFTWGKIGPAPLVLSLYL